MIYRTGFVLMLVITFLAVPGPADAQRIFQFSSAPHHVEILTHDAFSALTGGNPDVPLTDAEVIALAEKLYPPVALAEVPPEAPEQEIEGFCDEYEVGLLMAALQNPDISDATRREVGRMMRAAEPDLPKQYPPGPDLPGHFVIHYTDSDPNPLHNITEAEARATAAALNSHWQIYETTFRKPKADANGKIAIKIYYLGDSLLGRSYAIGNLMLMNSAMAVKDTCRRKNTAAHELFHMVQYSYGYLPSRRPSVLWFSEGTACWAHKYTNAGTGEYMRYMNKGLKLPALALLTERTYNAAHFWIFLNEKTGTYRSIKDVLSNYRINGFDPKKAVETVTTLRLRKNFDGYAQTWLKANYLKDLANAGGFEYTEDELVTNICSETFGPLEHVPRSSKNINSMTYLRSQGAVAPYAAVYKEFVLDPGMTKIAVRLKGAGAGKFSYHLIPIKDNKGLTTVNSTANEYVLKKTLTPGQWDKLGLVIAGWSTGGGYLVRVGYCGGGRWSDSAMGVSFNLKETDAGALSGTAVTNQDCGTYQVTGGFAAGKMTLRATKTGGPDYCCPSFTYTGTPSADCLTTTGTWQNSCGFTGNFTLNKSSGPSSPSPAAGEQAVPLPTTK